MCVCFMCMVPAHKCTGVHNHVHVTRIPHIFLCCLPPCCPEMGVWTRRYLACHMLRIHLSLSQMWDIGTHSFYVGAGDLNSGLHACEQVLLPTEPPSQCYRLLWSRRFCLLACFSFLPWLWLGLGPIHLFFHLEDLIWPQGSSSCKCTLFTVHILDFGSDSRLWLRMSDKHSSYRTENKGAVIGGFEGLSNPAQLYCLILITFFVIGKMPFL